MHQTWDRAAYAHHLQLLNGADVTFSGVFLPVILQILQEQGNPAALTVVDIGCATGFLTCMLADHVFHITGIDPSKASIEIAGRYALGRPNVTLENSSVQDYAKSHQTRFDFAIAHMTLHVIEDLDLALRSISGLLRKGGGFLFSVPHPCFWALIENGVGLWGLIKDKDSENRYNYLGDSSHENAFRVSNSEVIRVPHFHRSLESYSSALRSSGFVIERMVEPVPDDEVMRQHERQPWPYPRFLMVVCRKSDDMEGEK